MILNKKLLKKNKSGNFSFHDIEENKTKYWIFSLDQFPDPLTDMLWHQTNQRRNIH